MVTEYIMLNSEESDWVAGKFAVIQATLTAVGTGIVWIKRISYGFATESDMNDYISSFYEGYPDKTKLKGTLGEYQIVDIASIREYKKNSLNIQKLPTSNYPIG